MGLEAAHPPALDAQRLEQREAGVGAGQEADLVPALRGLRRRVRVQHDAAAHAQRHRPRAVPRIAGAHLQRADRHRQAEIAH